MQQEDIIEFISPIWSNIFWARKALGIYDGISERAGDINKTNHKKFFSLAQNLALEAAVITVCKIFETGNRNHKKHTILELCALFERELKLEHVTWNDLTWNGLSDLGMDEKTSKEFAILLNKNSVAMGVALMEWLRKQMPSSKNNPALKNLSAYRNKIAEHQECLNEVKITSARQLPSFEDMERIISWAEKFCVFVGRSLLGSNPFVAPCTSAKTATLNVMCGRLLRVKGN